jgi:hypothetical protein
MKSRRSAHDPKLKAVHLETVETQLPDNNPPETRQTLESLRSEGVSETPLDFQHRTPYYDAPAFRIEERKDYGQ